MMTNIQELRVFPEKKKRKYLDEDPILEITGFLEDNINCHEKNKK